MTISTADFLEKAGINYSSTEIYDTALTHSSWTFEQGLNKNLSNERLEFLGDAVLELLVSRYVYNIDSALAEGKMTKLRSLLIREETLASIARDINLGDALRMGKGEEQSGGRNKDSNLANAFEALLAAIYIDQGFESADKFLEENIKPYFNLAKAGRLRYDYKSALQELVQARKHIPKIVYKIVREIGPPHAKIFTAELWLDDERIAQGEGSSKKEAEQVASAHALRILEED